MKTIWLKGNRSRRYEHRKDKQTQCTEAIDLSETFWLSRKNCFRTTDYKWDSEVLVNFKIKKSCFSLKHSNTTNKFIKTNCQIHVNNLQRNLPSCPLWLWVWEWANFLRIICGLLLTFTATVFKESMVKDRLSILQHEITNQRGTEQNLSYLSLLPMGTIINNILSHHRLSFRYQIPFFRDTDKTRAPWARFLDQQLIQNICCY
mgnify:CR=1 FL=1